MDETTNLIAVEREALAFAETATAKRIERLRELNTSGANRFATEYISAALEGVIARLRHDLVAFGRFDDRSGTWRVGLYGVEHDGEPLVLDWRADYARPFYEASKLEPLGLDRRITYIGSIDDIFVEDFRSGEVSGSSPLLAELSREKGDAMRVAVATLQQEQDRLVRRDASESMVVRGGPGTGKTVVALHRAAWLVHNDTRLTAGGILVVGPSDRFLKFVAGVLPTLGEGGVNQFTLAGLLGGPRSAFATADWVDALDKFEHHLLNVSDIVVRGRTMDAEAVAEATTRALGRRIPWGERRKVFLQLVAQALRLDVKEVTSAAGRVWPAMSTRSALKRLSSAKTLAAIQLPEPIVRGWIADPSDGALEDEVRHRFEGTRSKYGHIIVDEAQDLSLLELRAMQRRASGLTLVGDDVQRSTANGVGLPAIAEQIGADVIRMNIAYRTSSEITDWLNGWALSHDLEALQMVGVRPSGIPVRELNHSEFHPPDFNGFQVIDAHEVWAHKGVEYNAVVVLTHGMTAAEVYLAASRAAHKLVVVAQADGSDSRRPPPATMS